MANSLKPSHADSGRERLLAAAARAFSKAGFADTGIASILQLAGVQAPTLYHHFGDKEGLFVAWAESTLATARTQLEATLKEASGNRETLAAYSKFVRQWPDGDLARLMRDANQLSKPENRERVSTAILHGFLEPLYAVLLRGIQKGKLRDEGVSRMGAIFLGGCLTMDARSGIPGSGGEDADAWWARRFVSGFGA